MYHRCGHQKKSVIVEFSCGAVGAGPSVVTAAAWVTAAAQVQSLAWELLHAVGVAKKMSCTSVYVVRGGRRSLCLFLQCEKFVPLFCECFSEGLISNTKCMKSNDKAKQVSFNLMQTSLGGQYIATTSNSQDVMFMKLGAQLGRSFFFFFFNSGLPYKSFYWFFEPKQENLFHFWDTFLF